MNTGALIMMTVSCLIVTIMTIYYFIKVLKTPVRDPANDSYKDTH